MVALSEAGRVVGESHPAVVLTDHQVETIRRLRESDGWSYGRLAMAFEISKTQVFRICNYQERATSVARWKPAANASKP